MRITCFYISVDFNKSRNSKFEEINSKVLLACTCFGQELIKLALFRKIMSVLHLLVFRDSYIDPFIESINRLYIHRHIVSQI